MVALEKKSGTGKVNDPKIVVRVGPLRTDDKAGVKLKKGQEVNVKGYAIDPDAGEGFVVRYQIEVDGQPYWTPGASIDFDEAVTRLALPFLAQATLKTPAQLLAAFGLTLAPEAVVTAEEVQPLVEMLAQYNLLFEDQIGKEGVATILSILQDLESHGVFLGSDKNGKWTLANLKLVYQAILEMATGTAALFKQFYGIDDPKMGFRVMYAPFRIDRNPTNNVSTVPDQIWYARNANGYELVLSNKVFFEGRAKTTTSNIGYDSLELIAHEVGHVINWRYSLRDDKGKLVAPDDYYMKMLKGDYTLASGEKVNFGNLNDGYTMAPRSSDGKYEIVTDAITCLAIGRCTDDLKGMARKEQVAAMMKRIIDYRVKEYGGYDQVKAAIQKMGKAALVNRMSPGLALIAVPPYKLDDDLAKLQAAVPA